MNREALAARAIDLHERNCNCAQAVACTLAPYLGADEDLCFRAAEGFGGGMGSHAEICGAVSGGVMAIGLAMSNGIDEPTNKVATYQVVAQLVERFRAQNGSTVCADLKGDVTGTPLRSCPGCIDDALALTADLLEEHRLVPSA